MQSISELNIEENSKNFKAFKSRVGIVRWVWSFVDRTDDEGFPATPLSSIFIWLGGLQSFPTWNSIQDVPNKKNCIYNDLLSDGYCELQWWVHTIEADTIQGWGW